MMEKKETMVGTELASLEARIRTQERLSAIFLSRLAEVTHEQGSSMLHTRLDDISSDISRSFRDVVKYQMHNEQQVDAHFAVTDAEIAYIKETMATKEDLADLEARMVTKQDLAALEQRVLGAFRQLIEIVDARLPGRPSTNMG